MTSEDDNDLANLSDEQLIMLAKAQMAFAKANGQSGVSGDSGDKDKFQFNDVAKFGAAIGHGFAQAAAGAASLAAKLQGKDGLAQEINNEQLKRDDEFSKKYGDDDSTSIGKFVGQTIPYLAGGEVAGAAKLGSALSVPSEALAKAMGFTKLAKPLSKIPVNAVAGATMGAASYAPDGSNSENATLGGAAAVVLPPAAKYAAKGLKFLAPDWSYLTQIGAYVPKQMARLAAKSSPVSAKDIKAAITASNGDVPLAGTTLQIPNLQKLEVNTLATSPLSGQSQRLDGLGKSLVQEAEGLHNILTNDSDRVENGASISDAVNSVAKKNNAANSELYKNADKVANKIGVNIPLKPLFKTARSQKAAFSKIGKLSGVSSDAPFKLLSSIIKKGDSFDKLQSLNDEFDQFEMENWSKDTAKDFRDKIKRIAYGGEDKTPVAPEKPGEMPKVTLKDATLIKSTLSKLAQSAKASGDRVKEPIFNGLAASVNDAIETELAQPKNKEAKAAYDAAKADYIKNIVPLTDKKIVNIRSGKQDTDSFLSTFLPFGEKSKNRTNLLNKLVTVAPDAKQPILTEALRSSVSQDISGNSFISAGKLASNLSRIGKERLAILTDNDPQKMKAVDSFLKNIQINGESLGRMALQKTGYQQLAQENILSLVNDVADASSNPALIFRTIAKVGLGRSAATLLKNPEFLQRVIAEKEKAPSTKETGKMASGLAKALIAPALSSLSQD
jgi:hypothetical protein